MEVVLSIMMLSACGNKPDNGDTVSQSVTESFANALAGTAEVTSETGE